MYLQQIVLNNVQHANFKEDRNTGNQPQQWKIDHSIQKQLKIHSPNHLEEQDTVIWNCTLQKMSKTQTFFLAEGAMSVTDNTQFHIKSSHTRNITQQEASHAPKLGSIQTLTPTHTTKLLRQTTHTSSSTIKSLTQGKQLHTSPSHNRNTTQCQEATPHL